MKVVLPGGTGQVGTVLARAFHGDGHEVVVLSRDPRPAPWRTPPRAPRAGGGGGGGRGRAPATATGTRWWCSRATRGPPRGGRCGGTRGRWATGRASWRAPT